MHAAQRKEDWEKYTKMKLIATYSFFDNVKWNELLSIEWKVKCYFESGCGVGIENLLSVFGGEEVVRG